MVILVLVMLAGVSNAQETKPENNTIYLIASKEVSKKKFDRTLKGLKEIKNTWYCAETNVGGSTGYNCEARNGQQYKYECISELESNVCSISKIGADGFKLPVKKD